MKLVIAIDPGASGGVAWHDGRAHVEPMPATDMDVRDRIRGILQAGASAGVEVCHIEKVGGYIGGAGSPGSAMFGFGFGAGFIHGVLAAYEVPVLEVTPQRWQKALGLGTRMHARPEKGVTYTKEQLLAIRAQDARLKAEWKNKLKAEAQRRFPGLSVTLKTSDALLILAAAMQGG